MKIKTIGHCNCRNLINLTIEILDKILLMINWLNNQHKQSLIATIKTRVSKIKNEQCLQELTISELKYLLKLIA